MPDKIIISGVEYKVIVSDKPIFLNNLRAYGQIDYEKAEINIDETLQGEQGQLQTFLHEIIHGIIHDREIDFKNDEEETIVDQIAKGLYQILKDNPKMFIKSKDEKQSNVTINIDGAYEGVDEDKILESVKEAIETDKRVVSR